MKIAVVGGHMAPALAFIDALPKDVAVIYIGREHVFEGDSGASLEQQTILKRGIRFIPFITGRIQRVFTPHTIPSLLSVPKGFATALRILKKEKPDIVVGFGGYLSVPLGVAAKLVGIHLVIHESTLGAGLANKLLIPFAEKICISWDSSREFFPLGKTVLTGNPLLPFKTRNTLDIIPKSVVKLPLVVVSGGSGGSHIVNMCVSQVLPELLEIAHIVHQTGDAKEYGDYAYLLREKMKLPPRLQKRYSLAKFISPEDINSLFAKAQVVVGRSGINTVSALLVLRKKAVLIPLPAGQKNEQLKNAKLLESENLAKIILQHNLSPKILFKAVKELLDQGVSKEKTKWEIPVAMHGSENLVKEVLTCLSRSEE